MSKRIKMLHQYVDPETRENKSEYRTLTLNELKDELDGLEHRDFHFKDGTIVFTGYGDWSGDEYVYTVPNDALLNIMLLESFDNLF